MITQDKFFIFFPFYIFDAVKIPLFLLTFDFFKIFIKFISYYYYVIKLFKI